MDVVVFTETALRCRFVFHRRQNKFVAQPANTDLRFMATLNNVQAKT